MPNEQTMNGKKQTLKFFFCKGLKRYLTVAILAISTGAANGQDIVEIQKMVASDVGSNDYMGFTVDISGDYAIAGAFQENEDENGDNTLANAGSAYIFERVAGTWTQTQKLVASDRNVEDKFGVAVAISGNYAIVGAHANDIGTNQDAGAAYIFERGTGGTWTQVQRLLLSGGFWEDYFGRAVAIDGDYAVVGAWKRDYGVTDSGAAYVYQRGTDGTWTLMQQLLQPQVSSQAGFGLSIGIDGDHIIVGEYHYNNTAFGRADCGAAYLFTRTGSSWSTGVRIEASDQASNDEFGRSVAISGDRVVVGAHNEDEDSDGNNTASAAGSAYVFEKNTNGTWTQTQKLVGSNRIANDNFGFSVAIDNDMIVVGAMHQDSDAAGSSELTDAGAAYAFTLNSSGTWVETQKLVASDRTAGDELGVSVAIDGNDLLAGSRFNSKTATGTGSLTNGGAFYHFQNTNVRWTGSASSDWNTASNWSSGAVPTTANSVTIPPATNTPETDEAVEINNLTLEAGATLIVGSSTVSVNGNLNNEGSITVQSGASFVLLGTRAGGGTETLERNMLGASALQLVSSPVSNATPADFSADYVYAYNNLDGSFFTPSTLDIGSGYAVGYDQTGLQPALQVSGTLNAGSIYLLASDRSSSGGDAYNLIGNPYGAAISAADFFTENASTLDGTGTAWLWADGGENGTNKRLGNYVTVNSVGAAGGPVEGTGSEGAGSPSKTIANWNGSFNSFQGFFVKATSGGGTVGFTPSMQVANDNEDDHFFRSTSAATKQLRLSLLGSQQSDNVLIVLDERATVEVDYSMDGEKWAGNSNFTMGISQQGKEYAIAAIPLPHSVDQTIQLTVGVPSAGDYSIQVSELKAFDAGDVVMLYDHATNEYFNLQEVSEIPFSVSDLSQIADRFSVSFGLAATSDPLAIEEALSRSFSLSGSLQALKLNSSIDAADHITIYTLSGQKLQEENIEYANQTATIRTHLLQRNQPYFLQSKLHGTVKFIFR